MKPNVPYASIPKLQRWHECAPDEAERYREIQGAAKFTFPNDAKVATAGSCFSARLATALRAEGFCFTNTEPAPGGLDEAERELYGYEPFSARYGFIYTTLALVQLIERAFGLREPLERVWERDGRYVDPFRPRIDPDGFDDGAAVEADRERHLAAVRDMFRSLDVFVFTAGLTETWIDVRDGSAFPLCPGVAGGDFDPERFVWKNLTVAENVANVRRFTELLLEHNPKARIVLSVSPVPAAATMVPQHIVRSSAYSKAALRAAFEEAARESDAVDYFASYDMVAHHWTGLGAYQSDGRHILPQIVGYIVNAFVASYFPDRERAPRLEHFDERRVEVKTCDDDALLERAVAGA